ncbi:MAG: glycosyltransferase family 2 protein [Pseudomonadota bacterium]
MSRTDPMQPVAVVTMVRDDAFFLNAWVRHYGGMFGRENCYVVNHGRGAEVTKIAEGCNIIGIPGDPHKRFDMKRWGLLNNIVTGLRRYYTHVIVGDVDELVVWDPGAPGNLKTFLEQRSKGAVITPLGMEIIHRVDIEDAPITDHIIGPRRHARPAPHYSKPCIISCPVKISRGGHFTQYDKLVAPDPLFLFHLKFCDAGVYSGVMNQRNEMTKSLAVGEKEASVGRHWFEGFRGEDRAIFEKFSDLRMEDGFNVGFLRKKMHRTFKARKDTGFYQFDRPEYAIQFKLPERFIGAI